MARISKRYVKLSIPLNDTSVLAWLQNQNNMSDSVRQLIRDEIERNGYDDMFCREVIPGAKRGRPTNAELQYRAEQEALASQEAVRQTPVKPVIVDTGRKGRMSQTGQTGQVTQMPQKPQETVVPVSDDDFIDPEELLGL